MRIGLSVVLLAGLFSAAPIFAQPPSLPAFPGQLATPNTDNPPFALPDLAQIPPPVECFVNPAVQSPVQDDFKFWASAEYWPFWVKTEPLPVSLLTGEGVSSAQELLDMNHGCLSGFRACDLAQNPPADLPVHPDLQPPAPDNFKFWVRAEYLAFWVKGAPLGVSLVTGAGANPTHGLLDSNQNLGLFSGFRVGFGVWFDSRNTVGMEASFFALQQRTQNFSASSDANGNPTLAFPFTNQTPGAVGDNLMPITSPGVFAGNVSVASTLQLWGTEANSVLVLLPRQGGLEIAALAGARYVDLRETLSINTVSSDILTSPATVLSQNDFFGTRNQFYGGQVGARVNWQNERFGIDLTGKLALGVTHETVDIQGSSTQTGPGGANGTFPGGFFTQPSNIGHYTANQFGVIPAAEMKFYVFITSRLRAFAGYDVMYWNQTVRPGSQIDHTINLTQSAVFGNSSLSGPAYPVPFFNRTDFWAQGITVGFEFRF